MALSVLWWKRVLLYFLQHGLIKLLSLFSYGLESRICRTHFLEKPHPLLLFMCYICITYSFYPFFRNGITIFCALISLLTVIGNVLVLTSIFFKSSLRSVRPNTFIASLGKFKFSFNLFDHRQFRISCLRKVNIAHAAFISFYILNQSFVIE